jgi:broad specificity phosphatase PhoE
MPGIGLDPSGRAEAHALARALAVATPVAVYASPLERTMQTASIIGEACGVAVTPHDAFIEMDVGAWTGHSIVSLDADATDAWRRFNAYRSGTPAPGGELQLTVQARVVAALLELASAHADATVVVVTHAEIIRVAVGHALGVPIDLQRRIHVAPASVSTIELDAWDARLVALNHGHGLPLAHPRAEALNPNRREPLHRADRSHR